MIHIFSKSPIVSNDTIPIKIVDRKNRIFNKSNRTDGFFSKQSITHLAIDKKIPKELFQFFLIVLRDFMNNFF